MAKPIQDTCISSSFVSNVSSSDTSSTTMKEKMQESEKTMDWCTKFVNAMCSSVGNQSYQMLESLLSFYTWNLLREVETCYNYSLRTAKLLTCTNNVLMFFHLSFQEFKDKISDHLFYFDRMAEILTIYLDLTLKMFVKDSNVNVVSRILCALHIFLDNSEEHIFRVLLGSKFINCGDRQICCTIFAKCFSHSMQKDPSKDINYVRYLLVLRLWKEIEKDIDRKCKVEKLALSKLGDKTPKLSSQLEIILPKPPKVDQRNGTLWLMQTRSLKLRKVLDDFIQYENQSQCNRNYPRTLIPEISPKKPNWTLRKNKKKGKKIVTRIFRRVKSNPNKFTFIDLTIDE